MMNQLMSTGIVSSHSTSNVFATLAAFSRWQFPKIIRVRLMLMAALMMMSCAAGSAFADQHTEAECHEGADFIRNAALSRDAGVTRDAFISHLLNDLEMIKAYPVQLRWFARDEKDEQMLIEQSQRVFDHPEAPAKHESAFMQVCMPVI